MIHGQIQIVDVVVPCGVIPGHEAIKYVFRPMVAPNMGWTPGPKKTPPKTVYEASNVSNQVGRGGGRQAQSCALGDTVGISRGGTRKRALHEPPG